jgi:hypothetical protein
MTFGSQIGCHLKQDGACIPHIEAIAAVDIAYDLTFGAQELSNRSDSKTERKQGVIYFS